MASKHQPARLSYVFLLTFCTNFLAASENCECQNNDLYIIRGRGPNGLVLDATEPDHIKVQHFTGSDVQLWQFVPVGRANLYHIINEFHGKALDIVMGDDGFHHLAVNNLHKGLQQQWNFGPQGHIANAANGRNIDVHRDNFTAGNQLIASEKNACVCQKFSLQKKI